MINVNLVRIVVKLCGPQQINIISLIINFVFQGIWISLRGNVSVQN
jgi:hypothetical protein